VLTGFNKNLSIYRITRKFVHNFWSCYTRIDGQICMAE